MFKSNAIANTLIMFAPIILMMLFLRVMSPILTLCILGTAYILGLTMLIRSKWSLFHQNIWFSFGPGKLDVENRRRYIKGYAIIVCAMILIGVGFCPAGRPPRPEEQRLAGARGLVEMKGAGDRYSRMETIRV
jgi:hypothetical protein